MTEDYHPLEGLAYGALLENLRDELNELLDKIVSGCISTEEQSLTYELIIYTKDQIERALNDWIFEIGHHFIN